jgi:hypothetical protein
MANGEWLTMKDSFVTFTACSEQRIANGQWPKFIPAWQPSRPILSFRLSFAFCLIPDILIA